MAASGVTAADFGRTNSSKKFFRTREEEGDGDLILPPDQPAELGSSKASADFLAQMRASISEQMAPLKRAKPSAKPKAPSKPTPQPTTASAPPPQKQKQQQPPPSAPPQKTFLSKAERRALKKRSKREHES